MFSDTVLRFVIDLILSAPLCLEVNSTSKTKDYRENFLGVKAADFKAISKFHMNFFIYYPNTTLLLMPYNLLSYFSKYFQQYAQYRTDKSKILTQSVHIPTCFGGGHYLHHGITLQAKTQLHNV